MNATHNDLDLRIKLKRIQILFKFKLYGVTRSHFFYYGGEEKKSDSTRSLGEAVVNERLPNRP
jgi:hypothetical protein